MAEGKEFSGVDDVFASIRSDRPTGSDVLRPPSSEGTAKELPKEKRPEKKVRPSTHAPVERPTARVGRFPGSKNKNRQVQDKISGRIAASLKDKYVDWALTDRCSINELLEKALVEYYQRHHAPAEVNEGD